MMAGFYLPHIFCSFSPVCFLYRPHKTIAMKILRFCWIIVPLFVQCATAQQQTLQASLSQQVSHWLSQLSQDQRQKAQLAFTDPERLRWGNEPYNMHPRKGLTLDEMTDDQKKEVHKILQEVLSEQGYLKVVNVLRLDDWLKKNYYHAPDDQYYGDGLYWMTVFGDPAGSKWGWRFEGHHLSLSVTVAPSGITVTPFFLGTHPSVIPAGPYAGTENLFTETQAAWQLLQSLDAGQKKQAVLADNEPGNADVLAQTGNEPFMKKMSGIPVSSLNASQQKILQAILDAYIQNLTPALAEKYAQEIKQQEWPHMYFAWIGGTTPGKAFYYRIQAPDGFIIEYCSRMNDVHHIHTLWRIVPQDFGGK